MTEEDYDPLFPTEDEDCVFVSESSSASDKLNTNLSIKPTRETFMTIPDLTAIPLPGDAIDDVKTNLVSSDLTSKSKTLTDERSNIPDKPHVPQDAPPKALVSAQESKVESPNKTAESDTKASPLNKIQMLIKQKAEQLKGSTVPDIRPSNARSVGMTFAIGKAKAKPTEKVKFSVLKLDRKVPVFNHDSDEESFPPLALNSPSKSKQSGVSSVQSLETSDIDREVGIHDGAIKSKLTKSPTKSPLKVSLLKKQSPTKPTSLITTPTKLLSPDPDDIITAKVLAKKHELEQKLLLTKKSVDSKLENSNSKTGMLTSPSKTMPHIQTKQSLVDKVSDTNQSELIKAQSMPENVEHAIEAKLNMSMLVSGSVSTIVNENTTGSSRPLKQSYEADSTIPDENAPNPSRKLLELYSDDSSSDDDDSASDNESTPGQAAVLPPAISNESDDNAQKIMEVSVSTVTQSTTQSTNQCVTSTATMASPLHSATAPLRSEASIVEPVLKNIDMKVEAIAEVSDILSKVDEKPSPQPVQPPETSSPEPVPPPQTDDVSQLTAVAQQLFQALSKRINPIVKAKEQSKDNHNEAHVTSSESKQRKRSKSRTKHSRSRSTSKERQTNDRRKRHSASRSGRSRSKNRRSRSRDRRSRSRNRSSYQSSRRYRRSRSRTRYRHRNRSRSSSRLRNRRIKCSVSPDYERRSSSHDRQSNSHVKRRSSGAGNSPYTGASGSKMSSSAITNQLIADNLALVSSSKPPPPPPPPPPTVLQYVYTADGQLCQIASSQIPQSWAYTPTTQIVDGPPPPPPGLAPPGLVPPGLAPPYPPSVPPPPMGASLQPQLDGLYMVPPQSNIPPIIHAAGQRHHTDMPVAPHLLASHMATEYSQPAYTMSYPPVPPPIEHIPLHRPPSMHGEHHIPMNEPRWGDNSADRQAHLVPPMMSADDRPRSFQTHDLTDNYFPRHRGPPPAPPGFNGNIASFRPRPRHPSTFARPYKATSTTSRWLDKPRPVSDEMDIVAETSTETKVNIPIVADVKDNNSLLLADQISVDKAKGNSCETSLDQPITSKGTESKVRRKSRFDDPTPAPASSTTEKMPSITTLSEIRVNRLNDGLSENKNVAIKTSTDSEETTAGRRRSSRIQSKECRTQAESKLKAEKEQQEAQRKRLAEQANRPDEETVDFVIDNRPSKKTIDLPNRPEPQSSPTKINPSTAVCAPGKLKMRWLQASKCQEENIDSSAPSATQPHQESAPGTLQNEDDEAEAESEPENSKKSKEPPYFERIEENIYFISSKKNSKSQKEAKRMVCDCSTSEEDRLNGIQACGEDCLNRMLMIECSSRCPCGDYCTNKRFERRANADTDTFLTENKGHGLKAMSAISKGSFIREYVGEVLGHKEFKHRVKQYARDQHRHYYFMALNAEEIIDATVKGNISRFINHSCDPNAETQKWTVNGKLRIGFFTTKDIEEDEEITFDYQFERYGKEAQKCYCGSANCRGFIGGERKSLADPKHVSTPPSASSKKKKDETKKNFSGDMLSAEIEKLESLGGLKRSEHVLQLSRLMVRADSIEQRMSLIATILDTSNYNCLRLFLSYQGLSLLWLWMNDLPTNGCYELKLMIINALKRLPITNKNIIQETKILSVVERLSKEINERLDVLRTAIKQKKEKVEPLVGESIAIKIEPEPPTEPATPNQSENENGDSKPDTPLNQDCDANNADNIVTRTIKRETSTDSINSGKATDNISKPELILEESAEGDESQPSAEPRSDVKPTKVQLQRQGSDVGTDEGDVKSSVDEDSQDDCLSQDGNSSEDTAMEHEAEDLGHLVCMVEELLEEWSQLKESFKIPKKQENEERKRTVHEIDTSKHDDSDQRRERKDSFRFKYDGRYGRKRRRDMSPDYRSGRRKDESARDLDPAQSYRSKQERRRIFEEQVRAEEEQIAYEQEAYDFYQQQCLDKMLGQEQKADPVDPYHCSFPQSQAIPSAYIAPQPQQHHQPQQQSQGYPAQLYSQPIAASQPHVQQIGFIPPGAAPVQAAPPTSIVQSTSQAQTVCYYTTPQGVVVQQLVQTTAPPQQNPSVIYMTTAATSQSLPVDEPPPPPAVNTPKLPLDWKSATDAQGRTYYYHKLTRQTQWEVPTGDEEIGAAMDVDTPPHTKKSKSKNKKTTMALADTSADAKKIKEHFKSAISVHIRTLLNGYMKSDCRVGKITNKDDYKFLAKKLTHAVLDKELKHCRHHEDLEVNENVKFKAKEFVKKYMAKCGATYRRDDKEDK